MTATYLYYSYIIEDLNLQTFFILSFDPVFPPDKCMPGFQFLFHNTEVFLDLPIVGHCGLLHEPHGIIWIFPFLFFTGEPIIFCARSICFSRMFLW